MSTQDDETDMRRSNSPSTDTESGRARLAAELQELRSINERQGGAAAERCAEFSRRVLPMHAELACQAQTMAYWAFMVRGDRLKARHALETAASLARRYRLPALAARTVLMRMEFLLATGHHDEAFAGLVAFLRTKEFSQLIPNDAVRTCILLASACAYVEPGDGFEACLALADARQEASGETMAPWFRLMRALLDIQRLLWASSEFSACLVRRAKSPELMRISALRLARDCEALRQLDETVPANRNPRQKGGWIDALRRALEERDLELAVQVGQALERECKVGIGDMARIDFGYLVAGVMLRLGRPQLAEKELARHRHLIACSKKWEHHLIWPHLEAAVAQALGKPEEALHMFQAHALAFAEQVPKLNMAAPRLLEGLVSLRGTRPADRPNVQPEYLRQAVALLKSRIERVGVAELARAVGVSERTLRDAFQVYLGMNPLLYGRLLRLEAARSLIRGGGAREVPLADLAPRFGFSNAGRFSKAYREQFGCSPTADSH